MPVVARYRGVAAGFDAMTLTSGGNMGFFDKLKAAANSVTGGGATVTVEIGTAVRGQPVPFRVRATAKADLKITSVYLLVRATEHATVRDTDARAGGGTKSELVRGREESYSSRVDVTGQTTLASGAEGAWEGTLTLPVSAQPTFRGRMIQHTWEVQAGLDTFGNDPDSGWVQIDVV